MDKKTNLLGEILLKCQLINQKQLEEALARHEKGEERIGEALISLGAVTQDEINWALGTQLNIPYLELNEEMMDQDLVKGFSPEILRRYQVVPVIKVNSEITLAMADPTDTQVIDDMKALAKSKIRAVLATSSNIATVIDKIFGPVKADKEKAPKLQVQLEEMDRQTLEKLIHKDTSGNTFVNYILVQAIKEEATEIHIQPTSNSIWVRYRIKGSLQDRGSYPIGFFSQMLTRIKIMGGFDPSKEEGFRESYIETQILDKVLDLHLSFLPAIYGESILIRLISQRKVLPTLEDCGFDEKELSYLSEILLKPSGVIIVTGGKKSGRTSTLYSLLGKINTPQKKIITIEDDIQHRVGEFVQIQTRKENYGQVLEKALGHNPDVIMVKDIGDKDVLGPSFHAALAGRLILGELSYKDSFDALEHILSADLERILISSTLLAIIAQKLVYRLCDKCKERYTSSTEQRSFRLSKETFFYQAKGCNECSFTGFTDRIVISELLPVTPRIKELILAGEHQRTIYQKAKEAGMKTIFDKGLQRAKEGIISLEEILGEREK